MHNKLLAEIKFKPLRLWEVLDKITPCIMKYCILNEVFLHI